VVTAGDVSLSLGERSRSRRPAPKSRTPRRQRPIKILRKRSDISVPPLSAMIGFLIVACVIHSASGGACRSGFAGDLLSFLCC
jgi:hypothetical protein